MKYSKAPWTTSIDHSNIAVFIHSSGNKIARCDAGNLTLPENLLNAKLMSASPDLFICCHAALAYLKNETPLNKMELMVELVCALTKAGAVFHGRQ